MVKSRGNPGTEVGEGMHSGAIQRKLYLSECQKIRRASGHFRA